jgi:D-beta-D-heptose 7-phosphate kinase/D-beta-D-heptose 1-phosphate adenosyltransferase
MKSNELKVLVIGESCIDKFIYCNTTRLSPEAPVPVLNPIEIITNGGMAANVVANVKALKKNALVTCLTTNSNVTKTRYVDSKSNHMFIRVDEGEDTIEPLYWSNQVKDQIIEADIVIVSDYNKGFLGNTDLLNIGHLSKLSILDSKRKLTQDIADKFTFIKLNKTEYQNNKRLNPDNLIVTLGSEGVLYDDKLIPQENPKQTIDVSGAGDTFTAAFILNYYDFNDAENAIVWANVVASRVVLKRGVATP